MNKLLIISAILLAAQAAHAQTSPSSDPSAAKSREQVKAEERASGSASKGNIEAPKEPSTKGSGVTRSEVKSSEKASGSQGTTNTEVPVKTPPK
jgi:hypothetical protein